MKCQKNGRSIKINIFLTTFSCFQQNWKHKTWKAYAIVFLSISSINSSAPHLRCPSWYEHFFSVWFGFRLLFLSQFQFYPLNHWMQLSRSLLIEHFISVFTRSNQLSQYLAHESTLCFQPEMRVQHELANDLPSNCDIGLWMTIHRTWNTPRDWMYVSLDDGCSNKVLVSKSSKPFCYCPSLLLPLSGHHFGICGHSTNCRWFDLLVNALKFLDTLLFNIQPILNWWSLKAACVRVSEHFT